MPHIVAATDFSSRSQRALRRAGMLATQIGAELTLVNVVDDDQPQSIIDIERREADKFMNEQIASLAELRGARCRALTTTGEAFDGILRTAKEIACDLIVMGSHRKQVLRDVFIGTTIERVIRTGSFPVLMVNKPADFRYNRIVAAVDLSDASARAVKAANALHLLDGPDVTLLHAFLAPAQGKLYAANASREQIDAYVADERTQAGGELAAFLVRHSIDIGGLRRRLTKGEPYEVIERLVAEEEPDLIVVGTHGRSAVVKILIGSVAEQILRRLDVDILAVPPAR